MQCGLDASRQRYGWSGPFTEKATAGSAETLWYFDVSLYQKLLTAHLAHQILFAGTGTPFDCVADASTFDRDSPVAISIAEIISGVL